MRCKVQTTSPSEYDYIQYALVEKHVNSTKLCHSNYQLDFLSVLLIQYKSQQSIWIGCQVENHLFSAINGRAYGNLEGLKVCAGDLVEWHVISFGESEGLHGVTFLGNNVMISKLHRDNQLVMSGLSFTALMHVQNLGRWGIICHNNNHFEKGMKALYDAEACGSSYTPYIPSSGTIRRYYIGAIETKWNYASITTNPLTGKNLSDANQ
ncbi:hypothetical protein CHS0354_029837 [Potamilus streckersoni]|uniref:Uncharacterized protein n=1 Tax=Potamilus streckersoni TaxID=2493646 RepID=A0AAE0TGZ8_9BIVA|nr:hypothetical protein CHS0354_029837 [Potamilus streckersoni]